jgi:RimJ/RimL family protein N-acetyltransferase
LGGCIVRTVRPIPLPDPPLSDGVVSLRQFALDDVGAVTAAMQDREVSRWTATIPWPYHESHAREWIGLHDQQRLAGEGVNFAITTGEGEAAIGAIGIHKFDWVKLVAQVGYWVALQERNRGLATHAAVLASQWALTDLGLTHLRLFTIVGNEASERVAAKAGYRMVEVLSDHDLGTRRATVKRWELLHV